MDIHNKHIDSSQTKFNRLDQRHVVQGHILKFIKKGKAHKDKGIICFPEQTYGNSKQSPHYFKGPHSVQPLNGYAYQHENKPQFKYYSQKRYFNIDGSTNQQLSKTIHVQDPENAFKFHRKKGKLTEFMDKNGWMNQTTKIMGFQRDQKARLLSNSDRLKRIQALNPKANYQNTTALKPNTGGQYFKNLGSLTINKMKLRQHRNDQAQRFSQSIEPRNIKSSQRVVCKLERESIEQKMLKSARDWSPSKNAKQKCEIFCKTFYSKKLNQFQQSFNEKQQKKEQMGERNLQSSLEDWHRTTCSSKWVYRKRIQSQESQQEQYFAGQQC